MSYKTDEERLQDLVRRLTASQTDVRRLWQRVAQTPDAVGLPQNSLESPGSPAYTPAMGPTTTAAPTTSTTTTPAPVVAYLYPQVDVLVSGDWNLSSGTEACQLLNDLGDWPDHDTYVYVGESKQVDLKCYTDGLFWFSSMVSVTLELYCKNVIGSAPVVFSAQILGDDGITHLTDVANVTGVGGGESDYTLRTATFVLEPEAQELWQWVRPTLQLYIETDNDAGSPDFYLSAVRVKPTYIPLF